jgi:1,2-phenylacetyl-CoA epoxidase PaaB subunit
MGRMSGALIHKYLGTIWTVAVLRSRDSYTRVYRGISLWIVYLAKRHVAHPASTNKRAAPQRGSSLRLSTVRDHEGAGQLDPRTVTNSI